MGAPLRIGLLAGLALALFTGATSASAQIVQESKNGCTSPQPYSGSLTSPPFAPPSNAEILTFQGWFEIEGVAPTAFDQIVVEYTVDEGQNWVEFGRLNPTIPPDPSGNPDQPYSNNGLNVAPSFQRYDFTLPVGDGPTVQIRFLFDTGDDTYQGFRGVGIDALTLGSVLAANFEQMPPGWTFDPASGPGGPFWQILTNSQNLSVKNPEINPRLVTLPDAGALPDAAQGSGYAWFGRTDSGTFCGPDFANFFQEPEEPIFDTTPPDTPITSGPPEGLSTDRTPTFTFDSTEPGSRFECSIDGAPFVPCASPFTTPELSGGPHTFAVRAIDASGNADPTPTVYNFTIARQLGDLPAPVLGREVNVGPVPGSGPILFATAGQGSRARTSARASQKGLKFEPLTEARQIPVGSFLNTKRGTVQLVTATGSGTRTQSGKFSQGLFQVLQSRARRARGLTEIRLKGGNFRRRCRTGRRGKAGAAQVRRRTIRRTRSNTNGRYRARGRHSAGTTRGTVWITADRCDGTLTTVKRGKVAVRDFRRKKTIIVRAGKRYLARAPR